MDFWTNVIAIIGALGGLEGIRFLINRKAGKRKANAEAAGIEFHLLQEAMECLEQRLLAQEKRYDEQLKRHDDQTQLLRKRNEEFFESQSRIAALELELARVRCNDEECPFRKPPTAKTPPPPGTSRDDWHKHRLLPNP